MRVVDSDQVSATPGQDVGTVPRRHKFPVWIDPVAKPRTPMSEAFNRAGAVLADWVKSHPESFPPILINISDGAATDSGKSAHYGPGELQALGPKTEMFLYST